MPYNNTPIDPNDDIKGTTHLPMSRVKKILAVDDEINQVSNHAVFLCTRAAELFVRHLADAAYQADRSRNPSKGKKSLQYEDVARVVHRTDNLEFLADAIPEPSSYGRHKRDKRRREGVLAEKKAKRATLAAGQTTLDASHGGGSAAGGVGAGAAVASASGVGGAVGGLDGSAEGVAATSMSAMVASTSGEAGASRPSTAAAPLDAVLNSGPGPEPSTNGTGRDIRFKHYEPKPANSAVHRGDGDGDVQMDG